jgi:monofunctional chorismate mutase
MNLHDYRQRIDKVDDEILRLFKERMDIARQIAGYKKAHGLATLDASRENEKLAQISEKAGDDMRSYSIKLFQLLLELSRAYQARVSGAVIEPTTSMIE